MLLLTPWYECFSRTSFALVWVDETSNHSKIKIKSFISVILLLHRVLLGVGLPLDESPLPNPTKVRPILCTGYDDRVLLFPAKELEIKSLGSIYIFKKVILVGI